MATSDAGSPNARDATPVLTPGGARAKAPLRAYVLHHYDWSESSLIVELFTRSAGRVVVAAKGAKRPTSNFRALLLPFQPLLAQFGKPPKDEQSEVLSLRSAEWAGGQPLLTAAGMLSGYYLNELLLKLLPRQDPHPALFDAYADTIAALAGTGEESAALRAFELQLLRGLGWLPELDTVSMTLQALQPAALYGLGAESGLAARPGGLSGATWLALEAALVHAAASGSGAALRSTCEPLASALRAPLRDLLHYHLGHSKLRTREVWQGVQRLADTR